MRTTTKGKSIAPFPDRIAVFLFFLVFVLISRWTPVAGDDWVYANSGNAGHRWLATTGFMPIPETATTRFC